MREAFGRTTGVPWLNVPELAPVTRAPLFVVALKLINTPKGVVFEDHPSAVPAAFLAVTLKR